MAQARPAKKRLPKLVLIGDSGVGKSSLLRRYVHVGSEFIENRQTTVGQEIEFKTLEVDGEQVQVSLWDTSGQEKFNALAPVFYREARGALLVYDVCDVESFQTLDGWLNTLDIYATEPGIAKVLIGNKIDKEDERKVTRAQGWEFASRHRIPFAECSAKTAAGVQVAFETLVRKMIHMERGMPACGDDEHEQGGPEPEAKIRGRPQAQPHLRQRHVRYNQDDGRINLEEPPPPDPNQGGCWIWRC